MRRALRICAVCVVALMAVTAVVYARLPGVGDAPARVSAIERAHHGHDVGALPARLAAATVAIEDERFWHHGPIDVIAIGRALVTGITSGADPGGSTIDQQLAKVLYVRHPGGLSASLRAIGLGAKLEQHYARRTILRWYLDSIYYGHGYWGARQASLGYFGVPPARLTWGQASLLAGLPQAPTLLDPTRHYGLARKRQQAVLAQLVNTGRLTRHAARLAYVRCGCAGPTARLASGRSRRGSGRSV